MRLDGDWYESTKVCLEDLDDCLAPNGMIILNDYHCWEGCHRAVDEFRAGRGIASPLRRIDHEAACWVKA